MKKNKFVAFLLMLCLLIASGSLGFTVYAATSPSWTTTVETGSMVDTASYIIFKEGSTSYAKNGTTGEIAYSGTNASLIIQNCIDACSNKESIFIKRATYDLDVTLTIHNKRVDIHSDGATLVSPSGQYAIEIDDPIEMTGTADYILWDRLFLLHIVHMQNLAFLAVGIIGTLYMFVDSFVMKGKEIVGRTYSFNWNWISVALIGLSVFSALLWWYYPQHVEKFSVQLETGYVWSNSQNFPQTLYTIDLDPTDSVNAGVWFWKENNLIHGWNTLVKIFWTLTFLYIGKLKLLGGEKTRKL